MELKKRNIYLFPFLSATILRLAVIPFLDISQPALMEYGRIAHNMLAGWGYSYSWFHTNGASVILPTAYMPPGQVFVQYSALLLFGEGGEGMIALYLVQILQFLIFLYLTGKISRFLFRSSTIESITLWLAAIYPPFIYTTMTFGVTSSALVLNALLLYLSLRLSDSLRSGSGSLKFALYLGLTCGALLLFRGESPVLIILTLLLILYQNKDKIRKALLYSGCAGFIALAVLAPWTVRNYLLFHRMIPISTNGAFNFWRGNNEITTGSPWMANGSPLWTTDAMWAKIEPQMDTAKDFDKINADIHMHEALDWIKGNPGDAALLSLKKALVLWTIDIRSTMGGTFAYISIYVITVILLMTGIFFIRKDKISSVNKTAKNGFQLMLLWCAVMTVMAMVFFPLPRFQVLLIGIYFPVVGYGLKGIARKLPFPLLRTPGNNS